MHDAQGRSGIGLVFPFTPVLLFREKRACRQLANGSRYKLEYFLGTADAKDVGLEGYVVMCSRTFEFLRLKALESCGVQFNLAEDPAVKIGITSLTSYCESTGAAMGLCVLKTCGRHVEIPVPAGFWRPVTTRMAQWLASVGHYMQRTCSCRTRSEVGGGAGSVRHVRVGFV